MITDPKISIRITSSVVDLDEITEALGQPSKYFLIGEKLGKKSSLSRSENMYIYDFLDQNDIEKGLEVMLFFLESREIQIDLIQIEFFCAASTDNGQGSIFIDNILLKKIADLNASFSFDFYA